MSQSEYEKSLEPPEECEWHEGEPAWPLCDECQAMYEADQENRMDAEREERS